MTVDVFGCFAIHASARWWTLQPSSAGEVRWSSVSAFDFKRRKKERKKEADNAPFSANSCSWSTFANLALPSSSPKALIVLLKKSLCWSKRELAGMLPPLYYSGVSRKQDVSNNVIKI